MPPRVLNPLVWRNPEADVGSQQVFHLRDQRLGADCGQEESIVGLRFGQLERVWDTIADQRGCCQSFTGRMQTLRVHAVRIRCLAERHQLGKHGFAFLTWKITEFNE